MKPPSEWRPERSSRVCDVCPERATWKRRVALTANKNGVYDKPFIYRCNEHLPNPNPEIETGTPHE